MTPNKDSFDSSLYLLDPNSCNHSVFDESINSDKLLSLLKRMVLIRLCEEKLAHERENGSIGGPVHLGAGQEAIAVGISDSLKKTDSIFSAHRSHPHLLALNGSPYKLFAEVLGKNTGYSKGMGGSMHLWNQPEGFFGSVPIVAGTVPLAVGASLSSKILNKNNIGVAYLGDGAIEEGVVSESLNLASTLNLPTLFIVENNLFSSHMHISLRQPNPFTARFAKANNIDYDIIDGNDVLKVLNVAKSMITKCRETKKPAFIEAITFRHYGHVDWRQDIDVGVNRSLDDLEAWHLRDPILRLKKGLIERDIFSENEFNDIQTEIKINIEKDWDRAMNDPYPSDESLIDRVFKE